MSIIVPALNEEAVIGATLADLASARNAGVEVLVIDGGSVDGTCRIAHSLCDRVIQTVPGRGAQLAAGAGAARGEWLWFLHADTRVPRDSWRELIMTGEAGISQWGRFDVRLTGNQRLLRLVEWLMNWRSCVTGIATGDQAIFVHRDTLKMIGGVPSQPLMEDIELSRRLRRVGRPACIRTPVLTSSRRWEERGVLRTISLMWVLRAAYALGVSSSTLARWYR